MIDLYYWPTPNGHKITIFLEEAGLDYHILPVNIAVGDQFNPDFLRISPNNKMPVIIDHRPDVGGHSLSVFESGAILLYLAEKTGRFLPTGLVQRTRVLEWLFWQVAGLGPMLGQNHHFTQYAPEPVPYAIERYLKETERLYGVLDGRLAGREFIADSYSIADMAVYPWIVSYEKQGQSLGDYPNICRWFEVISGRAAVKRAYAQGEKFSSPPLTDEKVRAVLFGQGRRKP